MSSFGENIQFYRKRENMTQEQLAEKLEVSRQTISKYEAGTSYPEMEKVLQLCDLFSCSMDTLMRENASEKEVEDTQNYDAHMEKRRRHITLGVMLLIADVAIYEILEGFRMASEIKDTTFMALAIVAILILVVAGMQHDRYSKKYPVIPEFYSKEEREGFEEKFPIRVAVGIGTILIGLLIGMNAEHFPMRAEMTEDFYYGIFLLLVAAGVGILVHTRIGKEKYDIAAYNRGNRKDEVKDNKIGIWCGCIMLITTIFYVITGFCFKLWNVNWVAYVVAALLCGIVALILKGKKDKLL